MRTSARARQLASRPTARCIRAPAARRRTVTLVEESAASCDVTVEVYESVDAVSAALVRVVEAAAADALAKHGAFCFAIPGGSVLKMLSGLKDSKSIDWSRTVLAFANHKCVPLDDAASTLAKAKKGFVDALPGGLTVIAPGGSPDANSEAAAYSEKLLAEARLRKNAAGIPEFDLTVLGVGDDGHVGSLYPNRAEIDAPGACVGVSKGSGPGSISLTMATMCASHKVVLSMVGESKADAVKTALQTRLPAGAFPAQHVASSGGLTWLLDAGAASKLDGTSGVAALM